VKIYYCRESEFIKAGQWGPKDRTEPIVDLLDIQVYKDDGFAYEFLIEEWVLSGRTIRLGIYQESFDAFADCEGLIKFLRDMKPNSLAEVQGWLDANGALNNLHYKAPGDTSPDPLSGRGRAGAPPTPSPRKKGRKA